jgi:hypothetical protein
MNKKALHKMARRITGAVKMHKIISCATKVFAVKPVVMRRKKWLF